MYSLWCVMQTQANTCLCKFIKFQLEHKIHFSFSGIKYHNVTSAHFFLYVWQVVAASGWEDIGLYSEPQLDAFSADMKEIRKSMFFYESAEMCWEHFEKYQILNSLFHKTVHDSVQSNWVTDNVTLLGFIKASVTFGGLLYSPTLKQVRRGWRQRVGVLPA